MARRTKAERLLEEMITRLYGQHCRGQINVLDIGAVFNAGRTAFLDHVRDHGYAHEDVARDAMIARFAQLRCD